MQTRILGFVQICHCDQRRHSMEQCIEQPGNALAWPINCSMLAGSSRLTCSLHKRMTWRPCSAPTFPKLESLSQANSKRTLETFNECRPFNCRASLVVSSCGWAVAPRLPVTPPWFNDSMKMAWTHSRDKNEHASLATSATTDRPATDERSGGSSCSSLLSGGHLRNIFIGQFLSDGWWWGNIKSIRNQRIINRWQGLVQSACWPPKTPEWFPICCRTNETSRWLPHEWPLVSPEDLSFQL